MTVPVLTTARLILRAFAEGDADALHPSLSDPELMTWWSRPPLESLDATRAYLAREHGPEWRWWVITRTVDGRVLGWVSAGEKRQGGVTEIGYIVAREAWGQGIAREAVRAVVDQLFAEGQRRVFADTDPDNAASNRLLEALGFTLEGRLRGEWETHIGVRDSLIWGLLRDEWTSSSASTRA